MPDAIYGQERSVGIKFQKEFTARLNVFACHRVACAPYAGERHTRLSQLTAERVGDRNRSAAKPSTACVLSLQIESKIVDLARVRDHHGREVGAMSLGL